MRLIYFLAIYVCGGGISTGVDSLCFAAPQLNENIHVFTGFPAVTRC